jgi:hypothetical protein
MELRVCQPMWTISDRFENAIHEKSPNECKRKSLVQNLRPHLRLASQMRIDAYACEADVLDNLSEPGKFSCHSHGTLHHTSHNS